ncbi:hypothetical protein BDW62DRAFT_175034 [Aspergillus aurantiobrunneus]
MSPEPRQYRGKKQPQYWSVHQGSGQSTPDVVLKQSLFRFPSTMVYQGWSTILGLTISLCMWIMRCTHRIQRMNPYPGVQNVIGSLARGDDDSPGKHVLHRVD